MGKFVVISCHKSVCPSSLAQVTSKTLAQQEEQLKKMETIGALQETNKMLKMDRDKLEQELQQAQAKVRFKCCMPWFVLCLPVIVSWGPFNFLLHCDYNHRIKPCFSVSFGL